MPALAPLEELVRTIVAAEVVVVVFVVGATGSDVIRTLGVLPGWPETFNDNDIGTARPGMET